MQLTEILENRGQNQTSGRFVRTTEQFCAAERNIIRRVTDWQIVYYLRRKP